MDIIKSVSSSSTPSTSQQANINYAVVLIERFDAVMTKMLINLKYIYGNQRYISIKMFYYNAKKAASNESLKLMAISKVILFIL